jgi:hypothetical protein
VSGSFFFFGVFEVDDGEMLILLEGDLISDRLGSWHLRLLLLFDRKHKLLVLCTMYSQKRLRKQLSYIICRQK